MSRFLHGPCTVPWKAVEVRSTSKGVSHSYVCGRSQSSERRGTRPPQRLERELRSPGLTGRRRDIIRGPRGRAGPVCAWSWQVSVPGGALPAPSAFVIKTSSMRVRVRHLLLTYCPLPTHHHTLPLHSPPARTSPPPPLLYYTALPIYKSRSYT
jgi:hypothetical protein